MHIEQYKEIVNKTKVYPNEVHNFGVVYCYLGLIGEYTEYIQTMSGLDEEIKMKEAGDVFWYITAFCLETGIDISSIYDEYMSNHNPNRSPKYYGQVCYELCKRGEMIKKFYRDNKELDIKNISELLKDVMESIFAWWDRKDIERVLTMNYEKLMRRRETDTIHGDGDNREVITEAI